MKEDKFTLKGKFLIEQLKDGEVIDSWEEENTIVMSGRAWLLSMISGINADVYGDNTSLSHIGLGDSKLENDGVGEGVNDNDWKLSSEGTIESGGVKCREPFDSTVKPAIIEDTQYLQASAVFSDDAFPILPYTIREIGVFISDTPPDRDPMLWADYLQYSMFSRAIRVDYGITKYNDGTDLRVSYKLSVSSPTDEVEAGWYTVEYEGFNDIGLGAITGDDKRSLDILILEEEIDDAGADVRDQNLSSFTITDVVPYVGRYLRFQPDYNDPYDRNYGFVGGFVPLHQEAYRFEVFIRVNNLGVGGNTPQVNLVFVDMPSVLVPAHSYACYARIYYDAGSGETRFAYLDQDSTAQDIYVMQPNTWYKIRIEADHTSYRGNYTIYDVNEVALAGANGVRIPNDVRLESSSMWVISIERLGETTVVDMDEMTSYRKPISIP